MRSILLWVLGLSIVFLLASAPALAADYDYYLVKQGDSLESIAAAHGLDPGALVFSNQQLLCEGVTLEPGMVLTIPRQPEPEEEDDGPDKAPASKKKSPRRSRASYGGGQVYRSGGKVTVVGSPTPSNRYVTSDGRVVSVPVYVPPPDPEEEEAARRSMASRSGRSIRGILKSARRFLGVPYVWGGQSASGFDCSGYVMYVFRMHGVSLPRTADVQFMAGRPVRRGQEQPGDLVFFETYAPGASHVGIYLGQGQFIHASSVGFVRISSLQEDFFQARYLGARRVL